MAGLKLDGAGIAKMKTLDEAILLLQRVHGQVENYAMAVRSNTPTGPFLFSIRRTLPTLAEILKGQFGLIADLVSTVNLTASRGASEGVRVRVLREGVGHMKQAIDIAVAQTKDKHAAKDDPRPPSSSPDAT
jgi:hypothetical protein